MMTINFDTSREATHRFRTSNNAKSNPEIKGRNSIFLDMTLYKFGSNLFCGFRKKDENVKFP
jgi:hypothetical protein